MSNIIRHAGHNIKNIMGHLPLHPFDYGYLMWVLRSYRSPRDKVSRMLKSGQIIQLKRGLYVLSPEYGGMIDRSHEACAKCLRQRGHSLSCPLPALKPAYPVECLGPEEVACHERLGGLLKHYEPKAA